MRSVTTRYLKAIANPVRRLSEVTVTLPGESTSTLVDIEADECTVTMSAQGARYSASIALSPDFATDVYALAAVPGAEFRIRAGISYGAGQEEWVDCGVYAAVAGTRELAVGALPLTLSDGTTRLEECRFISPWTTSEATRADESEAMVLDASPGVIVQKLATGGTMAEAVYERDRLAALVDLATGGSLDTAFDAAGAWVIRDLPLLNPGSPVWVLKTGETGTILPGAEREIPMDRIYNMVILGTPEPFQTWGAITVQISDPDHPRHWSKIGKRPFFKSDPTIESQAQGLASAKALLLRLLTQTEQIKIPTLGNAALEYGDNIAVAHAATETDPGLAANYLTDGWTFNLGTGAQDITGRSTDTPELEET